MKILYKHSESVYYKASNKVLISYKYNNGDFGNWIIP